MACRFLSLLFAAILAASSCTTPTEPAATEARTAPAESAPAAAAPAPAANERVHFVVLHTNDIHGQVLPRKATWLKRPDPPMVGGLARLAAEVRREKAAAEREGAHVLVVDGGDWFTGTPEGVIDGGRPFLVGMAGIGYDAVCVGNHEFDFGIPKLRELLRDSKLPAVVANLDDRATSKRIDWVDPWRVVAKGTWKIAIVGLVAVETPEITHSDAASLVFHEPAKTLARVEEELAGRADWILPITHLGVDDDRALARAHPDLPLVVGGHSHTFLKEGVREGSTLIVQTGAKASALGRVDLWFDARTKQVVESTARLIDLDTEPAAADRVAAVDAACAALVERSEARMNEVVGELAAALTRSKDPLKSSAAGNFMADALRAHASADVGVMNRGGIRTDLDAGPITRRNAFELCPFENVVSVLTLTGAELVEMLRRSVEDASHSGLEVSGVVVEVARGPNGERLFRGARVGGAPVDPAKDYRVAMNSFLADGGDAYVAKHPIGPKRRDDVLVMRDLIEQAFRATRPYVPNAEDRYAVQTP